MWSCAFYRDVAPAAQWRSLTLWAIPLLKMEWGGGVCRMEVSTSYCSWHPSSTEGQQSPQSSEAASDPSGCSLSAIGYWARPTLIWSTRAGLLREHFKNPLKVGCALCRGVSCVLSRYIPAEPNLNQCLRGEKLKIVSPALWETRSILGDRI